MNTPSISKRGIHTPESPIRKLAPYAEEAKKKGINIFHLNIGQPDISTPPEFFKAVKSFKDKVVAYGPSNGLPQMRESMKEYYHRNGYQHIDTSDIMITTAGSEAVIFSMMAAASPGDEIITFEPFYPNYNGFASMAGIKLVPIATDPEDGYHLPDRKLIEEKITSKTKAILYCSPNNPTGTILTNKEIGIIADIALKHNLFVLSDEVYREFIFEGEHVSSLNISEIKDRAVVMDSLSKRYSVCGIRIGAIVSKNKEFMNTVLKFGQARLCPPTLEQYAAAAIVEKGDKYFDDMLQEYNQRRDTIYNSLNEIPGVFVKKPKGAFYMMVTFPVDDIEDFARWILTDFEVNGNTVMLAPGTGFYKTEGRGKQEARIAYVLNCDDLKTAGKILKQGVEVYKNKKIAVEV
ncbi:MAG: pyridoxal phosphate-dependent aminotransferase [bacterium]